MSDFFKWWITDSNGKEYMTLIECSLHDWVWIALVISCLMIVWVYGLIGRNSIIKSRKYPNSLTKSYLIEMTNVFVFCAISGYLMVAISAVLNPYKLRVLLNIILFFWSYRFYVSMKKANVLENIYENEIKITELQQKISERLFQNKIAQEVTADFIWSLPLDKWIPLDGIRFKIIQRDAMKCESITECEPNSTFGLHSHPDLTETVHILEGHLIDDYNNIYGGLDDVLVFEKHKKHEPRVNIYSRYKVIFEK